MKKKITKTKSNMKKLSDAKVRVFWAENKYLGVFLAHLLRQGE